VYNFCKLVYALESKRARRVCHAQAENLHGRHGGGDVPQRTNSSSRRANRGASSMMAASASSNASAAPNLVQWRDIAVRFVPQYCKNGRHNSTSLQLWMSQSGNASTTSLSYMETAKWVWLRGWGERVGGVEGAQARGCVHQLGEFARGRAE
jgi:hypothetical protein